jgi:diguanylate cyclase
MPERLTTAVLGDTLTISVSDNGIGITAQSLPHVFELFVQDQHATAHDQGGLGIGLAVVRELVEAYGGTVVATSAGKDLGSEFVVSLPLVMQP